MVIDSRGSLFLLGFIRMFALLIPFGITPCQNHGACYLGVIRRNPSFSTSEGMMRTQGN